MAERADVLIIGAGSTGAGAAWALGRRSVSGVMLVEQRSPAAGTTARSCAILRMHYMHEPLARMAFRSRQLFENWEHEIGGDPGFRQVGWMFLALPEDANALAANVEMQRRVGIDARLVSPEEACEIAGGMSVDDVGAVAWEPDSGYADPLRTTESLVEAAKRSGVTYRPDVAVSGMAQNGSGWRVETSAGPILAGHVLVAAGPHTVGLLAEQGVELPVTFVRHTVAVMRRPDGPSAGPIVSDRIAGSYYRPTDGGEILVGSTGAYEGPLEAEPDADAWPRADALRMLRDRYSARFAGAGAPDMVGGYTSIYDCTPDLMPLLGRVPGLDGLSVAVGFSGHGFKIAPAVGDLLAEDLLEVADSDVGMFRLSRFEEGEGFMAAHPYSVPTLG